MHKVCVCAVQQQGGRERGRIKTAGETDGVLEVIDVDPDNSNNSLKNSDTLVLQLNPIRRAHRLP